MEALFVENAITLLSLKDRVASAQIPLLSLAEWIGKLKEQEDILEIIEETADLIEESNAEKQLHISMRLKLKGGMRNVQETPESEPLFQQLQTTLLQLISEQLSFSTFLEQNAFQR